MDDLDALTQSLRANEEAGRTRMPALFVGHGTPMNAVQDNDYSRAWHTLGAALPKPEAILCVSVHWMTPGSTRVHVGAHPRTIHDFGGFPAELFAMQYPAPGAPDIARDVMALLPEGTILPDEDWGLDHGAWSVLVHLSPKADVPVFQLSLDLAKDPQALFDMAARLKPLRDRGVLIMASGNLVHNLRVLAPGAAPQTWAAEFDARIAQAIEARDYQAVIAAPTADPLMQLTNPTPEHFLPVLFPLAVADDNDTLSFFNTRIDMGAIGMRSFLLA